ncbi:SDR family NAD(P)-dependent oxidoreductase [Acinetobacter gerneri]|uniref:SDR family NAD(P)-dependent oxidoreductase n=1 Tax=Acinetobacter gerneri TaxID=202952 RepID=UPI003A874DDC
MQANRLLNKVAIVTGVAHGIGQSCALMFAAQGATVIGCDIDENAARETCRIAEEQGHKIDIFAPCDLTNPQHVKNLVEYVIERFERIDILLNAAAFASFAYIENLDYAEWKNTLVGELDIVFLLCKEAWKYLKLQGGSIINFASANAWMALEGSPALAHCAGKGGILAMTRQLAMEGGPYLIRANTISPGLIETTATRQHMQLDPTFKEVAISKQILRTRIGTPEDIAWAAIYLASDESSWVTGTDLKIDAGATAS